MVLLSKEAWAGLGGFGDFRLGWEDYDFWCRLIEKELWGLKVGGSPLAEYRVHGNSMLRCTTNAGLNSARLASEMESRHRWLDVRREGELEELESANQPKGKGRAADGSRLERLLPILRCPKSRQALEIRDDGGLRTFDGKLIWPLVEGRPNLFPGLESPEVRPESHISNPLPDSALAVIEEAESGLVLNLSAGGTAKRPNNVIEAEAAVFRNTDVIADAHLLPFGNGVFDAVIAMNAFEHYRDPKIVAAELYRVLRPGGRILIRTAFLQPLHEKPWHFYNCTRYGLEEWFKAFETESLYVSNNFSPGHSLSWLASECENAVRQFRSAEMAEVLRKSTLDRFISLWREIDLRSHDELWSALEQLPQEVQESISAGFEYLGRKPL
jgi:SAM-dependent methyltransferase